MMKKVMSTEELKVFWDAFERKYSLQIAHHVLPPFIAMCNLAKFYENENIKSVLELSCGSGVGLEYLVNNLKGKEMSIYATDLSTNMLNATFDRLKDSKLINLNFGEKKINNESKLEVNLLECDNEDIKFSEDKKFDVVISSLSLHLVNDPTRMLKEVNRVLKDDGAALLSVWGRPENCPFFTLLPNILKKLKIPLPDSRSNFHLSDVPKLKNLVMENGFKKMNYCYMYVPFNISSAEEFFPFLENPGNSKLMENLSQETLDEIKKEITNEINSILLERDEFLGFENLIIQCKKL